MNASLTQVFLDHLPDEAVVDLGELDQVLNTCVTEAQKAWPQLTLERAIFIAHLANCLPDGRPVIESVRRTHIADLYLACACSNGLNAAINIFTQHYDAIIESAAKRVEAQGVPADETRQVLMTHLLMNRGERPPAIALYSGQGPLKSYLKVAALHKALHLLKKVQKAPRGLDLDEVMMVADEDDDPEIAVLKQTYRQEFKTAFQSAMGDLNSQERNLLRYHYLGNLNTRQISQLSGVNQSTVVRQLTKIRSLLLAATRERLMAELKLGESKFESIMHLVQSQLDFSIERVLGQKTDDS